MTIWILAVLLLASLAGLGLRQGAIRVAFSFVGIVLGALLATPLGRVTRPWFVAAGLKHATLLWLVPPVIVFFVVLIVFKFAGMAVHRYAEAYYKHKAGDLRYALWLRLNHRLGLCLGLLNATAYLTLISFVIYISSYWTVQLAASDANPKGLKILNQTGRDLQSTGMATVARAMDRMPESYYETADLAGMVYSTPLLEARLYRYPAFLGLAEKPEFQGILNDKQFTESWQRQAPILDLLKYPSLNAIIKNPDLLKTIWATLEPDLQDLNIFLTNGVSPKYESEKILGRWDFSVNGAIALFRKAKPSTPSSEMSRVKKYFAQGFAGTTLIAMTDQRLVIKNYPHLKTGAGTAPTTEMQTIEGQWRNADGKYVFNYNLDGKAEEATGEIEGDRLAVTPSSGLGMAFGRED